MAIEIEQDETRPEGGYVVLRLPGQAGAPERLSVQLTPLDDQGEDAATWAKHPFQPAELRRSGEDLELVLGPEVVNGVPADLPLRVTIAALGIEEDCLWPSLRPLIAPRAGRVARVPREAVVGPARPRKAVPVPVPPKEEPVEVEMPGPGTGGIKPDAPTKDETSEVDLGPTVDQQPERPAPGPERPSGPPPHTERPRRPPLAMVASGFLAGLALGAIAIWALSTPERNPEPASDPDLALLRAIDTGDLGEDGAPIFRTAAREWLRRGDQARLGGDLAGAELNYRRALRSAWHENGAEPDAAIGRLAALLDQGGADPDKASQLRALMMLSAGGGDPAGMCRLALLYEKGVGGPADLNLAAALRTRATALLAGAPVPAGCD